LDIASIGFQEPVIASIPIDLQNAFKAIQYVFSIFTGSPRRISKTNTRWARALPSPVISRECPEIPLTGFAPTGFQDRRNVLRTYAAPSGATLPADHP